MPPLLSCNKISWSEILIFIISYGNQPLALVLVSCDFLFLFYTILTLDPATTFHFQFKKNFLMTAMSQTRGCFFVWVGCSTGPQLNSICLELIVCPCSMIFILPLSKRGQQPLHWAGRHWYWIVSPRPHLFLLLFFGSEATRMEWTHFRTLLCSSRPTCLFVIIHS